MSKLENDMTGKNRAGMNPLWVLSLFITFTETVLGAAVTQTEGIIQYALTAFVIIFPVSIAIIFFLILWKKPWVLYAPRDFGSSVNIGEFVKSMKSDITEIRKGQETLEQDVQEAIKIGISEIKEYLDETTVHELIGNIPEKFRKDIERELRSVSDKTLNRISQELRGYVEYDRSPLKRYIRKELERAIYHCMDPRRWEEWEHQIRRGGYNDSPILSPWFVPWSERTLDILAEKIGKKLEAKHG